MCLSLHQKIFWKKIQQQNQTTTCILFAFLKKITTKKSSANFLSPEPNGQGWTTRIPAYTVVFLQSKTSTSSRLPLFETWIYDLKSTLLQMDSVGSPLGCRKYPCPFCISFSVLPHFKYATNETRGYLRNANLNTF